MTLMTRVGAALLLLGSGLVAQVEPAPRSRVRSQPDRIDLGRLYVGARVETSFAIFWGDPACADQAAELTLPPFVELRQQHTVADERYGARTEVGLLVHTGRSGDWQGAVAVRCGGRAFEVPITAVVLPASPIATRVLVADAPFVSDSTSDGRIFDAWRKIVETGKLEVNYLTAPAAGEDVLDVALLGRVDVVLLSQTSLTRLTPGDIRLVQGFVCGGGRVLIAASTFWDGTVDQANEVMEPFGIRMRDVEGPVGATFVATEDEIVDDPLTDGVEKVEVHRPSPTVISDETRARALVKFSERDAFIALAHTGTGGEVIAIGNAIWWSWASARPDNARLLRNLLVRPGARSR